MLSYFYTYVGSSFEDQKAAWVSIEKVSGQNWVTLRISVWHRSVWGNLYSHDRAEQTWVQKFQVLRPWSFPPDSSGSTLNIITLGYLCSPTSCVQFCDILDYSKNGLLDFVPIFNFYQRKILLFISEVSQ